MTEQEQRYLIRGMSLARVILLKAECPHHTITIVRASNTSGVRTT